MKFTTTATATFLLAAAGAQAQTNITGLIDSVLLLLTPNCSSTLESLVSSNSSAYQCLLGSDLTSAFTSTNTSLIPGINSYLINACAAPACNSSVIEGAVSDVLGNCSTDLLNLFGLDISNSTAEDIVDVAYEVYYTGREVACLSSNATTNNATVTTNSTSNFTLCPIELLTDLQSYLGAPLSFDYIETLALGGNSTGFNLLKSGLTNISVIESWICNDCVAGSLDIVFDNFPELVNVSFAIPDSIIYNVTGNASFDNANSTEFSLSSLYTGVCNITVGYNETLPATLNETAFNTTVSPSNTTTLNITDVPLNITGLNISDPISVTSRSVKISRDIN